MVKNLPAMWETWVLGLGRPPGAGHGNPLQYSCLENPYRQRSLAGYSPWGRNELDTTEQLNTIPRKASKGVLMGVRPQGQGVEASPLPFPPVIPSPPSPFVIARTARDCKGLGRGRERERGRRGRQGARCPACGHTDSFLWPSRFRLIAELMSACPLLHCCLGLE